METNSPISKKASLNSWLEIEKNSDFPIQNLPLGLFRDKDGKPKAGMAIGDYIINLHVLAERKLLSDLFIDPSVFCKSSLNDLMRLGKNTGRLLRQRVADLMRSDNAEIRDQADLKELVLCAQHKTEMLLPVSIGDYTDFYSSIDHATNVGTMFRGPENALMPNWKYLPVGYHGRSSSIVVSGTNINRPKGQIKPNDDEPPIFAASRLMDFELEMAFITGKENKLGEAISIDEAEDYIYGLALFNDLSARDIQKWEYVPLGPFLGKNFGSVISPWIVSLDALEPFRTEGYQQEPEVLPYLKFKGKKNYDINLEVEILPEDGPGKVVSYSNFKYMYWNMCQQLAHQSSNGCNIRVGDLYASGTISGPDPGSFGSMLEITWRGTKPIIMPDGTERKFLQNGDTVVMRGWSEKNGLRIGFGECKTKILPAR